MPQIDESLDSEVAFRNLRIFHLAMSGAVLVYGVLVSLILSLDLIPKGGLVGHPFLLRFLLWSCAVGCLGAIQRVRVRFLTPEGLRQRTRPVAQSIVTWNVIIYALANAMAIYGLLLFLTGGLLQDFLVLAGFALAILVWLRPTAADYWTLVRQPDGS